MGLALRIVGSLGLAVVWLWAMPMMAAERTLELDNGNELSIEVFEQGKDRILWLPSEYGFFGEPERQHAERLAQQGYSVWVADLHTNYFLPISRNSLDEIPGDDLLALVRAAEPKEGRLYLFSYARGAAMSLEVARQWQLGRKPGQKPLGGVVLLHPNLMAGTARPGDKPEFLPITSSTNLPLFVMQPLNSAKRWYLDAMVEALQAGGSDVFTRMLPGVSDGYQVRDDATPFEQEERKKLPQQLARAVRSLKHFNKQRREPVASLTSYEEATRASTKSLLSKIKSQAAAPPLKLTTIKHNEIDLESLKGEVVLVNFWATWCPPCVEEIPSLGRLAKKMAGKPFRVVSVDVGEDAETVKEFLEIVPADFPVMLDPEGSVIEPWKIRAFPTSFIIDQQGRMRYGYYGGLEWDSDEVVAVVDDLLAR